MRIFRLWHREVENSKRIIRAIWWHRKETDNGCKWQSFLNLIICVFFLKKIWSSYVRNSTDVCDLINQHLFNIFSLRNEKKSCACFTRHQMCRTLEIFGFYLFIKKKNGAKKGTFQLSILDLSIAANSCNLLLDCNKRTKKRRSCSKTVPFDRYLD